MPSLPTQRERSTAVYRSRDAISNFRLRVRLQRVTSSSLFLEMARQQGDEVELKQMRQLETHSVPETRLVSWQQKIFSRREFVEYGRPTSPNDTPLVEKYRKSVAAIRNAGEPHPTNRIFSYVDVDAALDANVSLIRSPDEEIPRPMSVESFSVMGGKTKQGSVWRTMRIVADLTPEEADPAEEGVEVQVVLCTLHYNLNGTFIIDPDFNPLEQKQPYRVESLGGLDSWEIYLENASEPMLREEMVKESNILARFYERHAKARETLVGVDFEVPPPDGLRLTCFGEIVSARGFEYDRLYVAWRVVPGKWWWSSSAESDSKLDSVLTGSTHCCGVRRSGMAMFGECFELDLVYRNLGEKKDARPCKTNRLKASELSFSFEEWPQLLLQVMSRDSWHRTRTEGYGVTPLPTRPGSHSLDIHCWRPVGGPVDELRRYFVGGSPELDDPFYIAKPSVENFESEVFHLNQFGLQTISTGSVRVRMNLVFQSQSLVSSSKSLRSKSGTPFFGNVAHGAKEKHGGMFHLISVVQAFQQARSRMVEARESLLKDLKIE